MTAVLLTDYAWPGHAIEQELVERAGFTFAAGPGPQLGESAVEDLVRMHRPAAILTCWSPVTAAAIAAAPDLKIVARLGIGLDNIAVDAARARGIAVTNVPDYCVEEVSDHAIALLLAWARGISAFDAAVKDGRWNPAGARLRRVQDLTVGILGYGRIGHRTAQKLKPWGATLLGHGLGMTQGGDGIVAYCSDTELFERSDAVIVHMPLTPQTQHFVNAARLALMKPGSFLVNVGRGGVVDSAALAQALRRGAPAGAGLDVVEGEPEPPAALRADPNVIWTPHVAFSSDASIRELRERATADAIRALKGEPLRNPVGAPGA